jgi:hypothetical protein
MKNSFLALVVTTSLALSGCSLFETSPSRKAAGAEQAAQSLSTLVKKTTSGISITWEVPSEPTDGFIIRYGDNRAQLSKEVVIMTSDLREEQDSVAGPVYRYIIKNVPRDKQIFVSIAAFKGGTVSDFSEPANELPKPAQQ